MTEDSDIQESGVIKFTDDAWAKARFKAEVISPLADKEIVTAVIAREAAQKLNLSQRTVYSLIKKWRESRGSITSLISEGSNGGRGGSRLNSSTELLISNAIVDIYLSRQKPKVAYLMQVIRERCHKEKLKCPSLNTVKTRIKKLQHEEVIFLREGADAIRKLQPIIGCFPDVANPLDIVQIDHTPVDLIIVDTYTRQPIGRPWLTIAIDIYSRCITGFCLTLEPPSAISVGLCLAHTVINKRSWLDRIGVEVEWPIFGKPKSIHVDNGADFHSEALRRGCEVHGIKITYRPVGSPHYGGIIERVIGTMMQMVHNLPGTTFSNIAEKGKYDSEKNAAFTLAELEKWFVLAIYAYHSSIHSTIGETPINRWKKAVDFGWQPYHIQNAKAFLVDFLPVYYRCIQREGFVLDHIIYMSNSLKPWISNRDSKNKFVIRRDPRDLSRIYVLDSVENKYLEVPYRSIGNPAITLWEHRLAVKRIKEEGRKYVNEEEIIKIIEKMRVTSETAISKSKAARRKNSRLEHLKDDKRNAVVLPMLPKNGAAITKPNTIKKFDDIEEW
jgi:putative transposase